MRDTTRRPRPVLRDIILNAKHIDVSWNRHHHRLQQSLTPWHASRIQGISNVTAGTLLTEPFRDLVVHLRGSPSVAVTAAGDRSCSGFSHGDAVITPDDRVPAQEAATTQLLVAPHASSGGTCTAIATPGSCNSPAWYPRRRRWQYRQHPPPRSPHDGGGEVEEMTTKPENAIPWERVDRR